MIDTTEQPPISIQELIDEVDEDLVQAVFDSFVDDMQGVVSKLENSLELGDAVKLQKQAHAVKGCCRSIRAQPAAQSAEELEHCAADGKLDEAAEHFALLKIEINRVMDYINNYPKPTTTDH